MTKSAVYHGETYLGEVESVPLNPNFEFPNNEIRITQISPPSERCHPLSVLQTISPFSVLSKLEPASPSDHHPNLLTLHASCFYELKTAVVVVGNEEIHLVAMPSKQKKFPCFWCYAVPPGLYNACLSMLNLRCLSIVFDLDETLIVANTMKSFEDRIEALKVWISREPDHVRSSGMSAELKRYVDDRALLKQFTEGNSVVDGGKVYKVHMEEVTPLSDNHEAFVRPVIRLPDKNIVLTRINPENRDTSVLVRLRPAWEDLRSYLNAKGRKRFEVFVCTMAERDYALEMWRLLDPEAHLINSKQLLNRVVCVKSGSRKSLLNVFQDGLCHPNMAMVIDDRLKVWEDKDQLRVHVVPAFTPYYAPQAEMANAVPVLCVARNVACNVRGGFFKEFDENFVRKISELFYEDDVSNLPAPPDASNYLISEDAGFAPNGNTNIPGTEGISGAEVEQRLIPSEEKISINTDNNGGAIVADISSEASHASMSSASNVSNSLRATISSQKSLLGVPMRRDVRNPSGNPPILRLPGQTPQGGWSAEDVNRRLLNNRGLLGQEPDVSKDDKPQTQQSLLGHGTAPFGPSNHPRGKAEEAHGQERKKQNLVPNELSGGVEAAISHNSVPTSNKETLTDAVKISSLPSSLSISVLQEIGRRCSSKVEFKPILSTSKDLQFSVEVLFTGEKIGIGMGKTRKDAQQQAAENALRCLADKYMAYVTLCSGLMDRDFDKHSVQNDNGFVWDDPNPHSDELSSEVKLQKESTPETTEVTVVTHQAPKRANSPRLQHSLSSKRSKDEIVHGSQGSSSIWQQRNDNPLS